MIKVVNPGVPYDRIKLKYLESILSDIYPGLSLSKNILSTFLKNLGGALDKISSFMYRFADYFGHRFGH